MTGLTEESQQYLARRPLADRQALGQFLTPARLRDALLAEIRLPASAEVLDPGVGTGEFLRTVRMAYADARLTGWDVDPEALTVARELAPDAELVEGSALELAFLPGQRDRYDLVIGNPPYFQWRASREVRDQFRQVISGRPNIFALFFQCAVQVAKPGGIIAYVVPPSMNNGAYFDALRAYLMSHTKLEYLKVFDDPRMFADANTAAQLIVLRKRAEPVPLVPGEVQQHSYVRDLGNGRTKVLFSDDARDLAALFGGHHTLYELGYEAVTGTVIWNQNRERLRTEPGPDTTTLIWAHNIEDGEVVLRDGHKRAQYVAGATPVQAPAIVVNRIVGAVGRGQLRAALVPSGPFVGENHVNVVRRRAGVRPAVDWDALLDALRHPGVSERIRKITGNTQISATELTHLIPLKVSG